MKNRKLINEVRQFKKIAGLLKEDSFSLSDNPLSGNRPEDLQNSIRNIVSGLDSGESLVNLVDDVRKVYPEYVQRILDYNVMEQEIISLLNRTSKGRKIVRGLESGDSLINQFEGIEELLPQYAEQIEAYQEMEEEILDRAYDNLD